MERGQTLAAPAQESPLTQVAKIVGVFILVGIGVGAGTLIFLSATGFFEAARSEDLDALGAAFIGGIALATVLVFTLLIGIVLAAVGGMYAARSAESRGMAAIVGAIAGIVGHIAMVAALGVILIVGVDALSDAEDEAAATPTPAVTMSPEEHAECVEFFGASSPACGDSESPGAETSEDDDGSVSFEDIWRIGLGLMPAGLVGGLSAAILHRRRYPVTPVATD